ncbi:MULTISPECIES: hypothetical protein [unclassified Legionella]|uniref:hypothetical protein n=1 Tax=unclassified Legionella TaxID=2622702 RepID=UPI0010544152|nr:MULTISPECIES: hypothetical protein [unclassified Legionella]MDI9818475.1 hypothetical protein [Legionella sp. PL877]
MKTQYKQLSVKSEKPTLIEKVKQAIVDKLHPQEIKVKFNGHNLTLDISDEAFKQFDTYFLQRVILKAKNEKEERSATVIGVGQIRGKNRLFFIFDHLPEPTFHRETNSGEDFRKMQWHSFTPKNDFVHPMLAELAAEDKHLDDRINEALSRQQPGSLPLDRSESERNKKSVKVFLSRTFDCLFSTPEEREPLLEETASPAQQRTVISYQ